MTTDTIQLAELAKLKQGARQAWAAGDFPAIAQRELWPVGALVVERAAVAPGETVLDVACGTGNAALRAAQAGARVTGLDITPELLDEGRRLAAELGVSVDWVQGDAEELPYEDGSFDVVLSTFGHMFAPRHAVAARELARVLAPGGRLVLTTWKPEGEMGAMFRDLAEFLPPPPPFTQPPLLWGSPAHVEEQFAGTGVTLEFGSGFTHGEPFGSPEETLEFMATKFGPMMVARSLAETSGRWDELRERMLARFERDAPREFLLILGTKGVLGRSRRP